MTARYRCPMGGADTLEPSGPIVVGKVRTDRPTQMLRRVALTRATGWDKLGLPP